MFFKQSLIAFFLLLLSSSTFSATSDKYPINIKAGKTAVSLGVLAEQTDLLILYPFELVSEKKSAAVNGNLTVNEALAILLEKSGLEGKSSPSGLYKISEIPPPEKQPVTLSSIQKQEEVIEEIETHLDEHPSEIISIVGHLSKHQQRRLKRRYSNLIVANLSLGNSQKHVQHNIGDLLHTAVGTSIDYRKREGLFLTVRGFGPELNTVLYNNHQLPTTSLGSGFSFDTLSSEMFLSSDIYKTQATELVSGGVGATVNLVSQPVIGQDSYEIRGGLTLSANDDGDYFPELFASLHYSGKQFASIFSVNFLQQDYRIESANTDGWFTADLSDVEYKAGSQDYSQVWVPRNFDLRIEQAKKKRMGISWVSKLKLTPDLYFTTDLIYSRFDVLSNITSSANWTHIYGKTENETFESITVDQNDTLTSYRYKDEQSFASDFVQLVRNRPSEMFHLGSKLSYDYSQTSNMTIDLSYAIAKSDNGGNRRFSAVGSPNANPEYTLLPNRPYANVSFEQPIQAADLRSHITIDTGDDVQDKIFQLKVDMESILSDDNWEQINLGFYYADRNKQKIAFRTPWGAEFGGYEFDLPDEFFNQIDASDFLEGGVPEVWYGFDSQQYIDYLWSDEHIQQAIIDTQHPLADTIELRKQLGGFNATELPNSSWHIQEQLAEAYIKAFLSGQIFNLNWSGQMGVRLSATRIDANGYDQGIQDLTFSTTDPTALLITYAESSPVFDSNSYINWLPNINFKLDLNNDKYLSFGMSKTISRPTLSKLAPTLGEYAARAGASTAIRGNPQLKPYESINLDMGWSWFFDETGLVDLTLYYKSVDNFILQRVEFETLLDHPEGDFLVVTPFNLSRTSFFGYEFVYQNQFESFPFPFNGVGIELRYTHVDAEPLEANDIDKDDVIEGLSDNYSLVLYYTQDKFSGSLIYHYRDEFVRKQSGLQGQPEMVEGYGQLDLKLSYQWSDNISISLEGQNLARENPRSFSLYHERLLSYEQHQRNFTLGLNLRF
tara:strand:+ start:5574 stop:8591 length:3018 start_codon:yes stop_codon:yes gene_type:complete